LSVIAEEDGDPDEPADEATQDEPAEPQLPAGQADADRSEAGTGAGDGQSSSGARTLVQDNRPEAWQGAEAGTFLPSAFARDESRADDVDITVLSRLPLPILIHAGD